MLYTGSKPAADFLGAERLLAACHMLDQGLSVASVSAFQITLTDTLTFMLSMDDLVRRSSARNAAGIFPNARR